MERVARWSDRDGLLLWQNTDLTFREDPDHVKEALTMEGFGVITEPMCKTPSRRDRRRFSQKLSDF